MWLQHVDLRSELQAADLGVLGWAEASPSLQDSIHAAAFIFPHVDQQPQMMADTALQTSDKPTSDGCVDPSRPSDGVNLPAETKNAGCKETSADRDLATHLHCQHPGMGLAKAPADQQTGIPGPNTNVSTTNEPASAAVLNAQASLEAPQNDQFLLENSIRASQPSSMPSCTQICPIGHAAKKLSQVQAETCNRNSTAMHECAQTQTDSQGQGDKPLPAMPLQQPLNPERPGTSHHTDGLSRPNSAGPLQASSPQEIHTQSILQSEVQPAPKENIAEHPRQPAANVLPGSGWHSSRRGKRKAAANISQTGPDRPSAIAASHASQLNTTNLHLDGSGRAIAHQLPDPECLRQITDSSKSAQRQRTANATLPSQVLAPARFNAHSEDLVEAMHTHQLPAAAAQKLSQQLAELAMSCSAAALHIKSGAQKGTGMTSADANPNARSLKGRRIAFVLQDDYHHTDVQGCHDIVSAGLQTGQYVLR